MENSDSQIDKPERGRPKRAELPDVNTNTGVQSINSERASTSSPGPSAWEAWGASHTEGPGDEVGESLCSFCLSHSHTSSLLNLSKVNGWGQTFVPSGGISLAPMNRITPGLCCDERKKTSYQRQHSPFKLWEVICSYVWRIYQVIFPLFKDVSENCLRMSLSSYLASFFLRHSIANSS